MHFIHDPDEWETVSHSRPCTSCGGDLGKCRGVGCNGSFGVGQRRRSSAEVAKIKAEKLKAHEDAVLAEADAIRARLGNQ